MTPNPLDLPSSKEDAPDQNPVDEQFRELLETERKRVEAALRESEERSRLAQEAGKIGIFDWDAVTGRSVWTAEQEAIYGLPTGGFGGSHEDWLTQLDPRDRARVLASLDRVVAEKREVVEAEYRIVRPDGEIRWVSNRGRLTYDSLGRLLRHIGTTIDITERKRAEADLQLRDRAIRAVPQGILITDPSQPDNPIIYVSPGFERLTGYTAAEAVGRNSRFIQGKDTDPEAVKRIRTAIDAGEPCTIELQNYRKDGTPFWNEVSISPVRDDSGRLINFVGIQTDVTARRSLEEQFRQSQKMDAVGRLAGGVAHDFNNLLTIINGYGELILGTLAAHDPNRELVQGIVAAGERAAGLTRQLLAFSRKAIVEPKVLDLRMVVTDVERMLRRIVGEDIHLTVLFDPEAGIVRADHGQMEQVILNLAVNARDAMPTGGHLTIEVRNVELDESYTRDRAEVQPGQYALLAITDTGGGMDDATLARVFEPFFSTKGEHGTGLGLATVHGIVKQSGGHVAVYSEMGHGTVFKVYLPRIHKQLIASPSRADLSTMPKGGEWILIVEDEDGVRALTRHVLQDCGYRLLEARDGTEAELIVQKHPGRIDLLITDVVMPRISGREVARRLTQLHPEIRVLFLSGYTDDAVVRHGILEAEVAFLQKPFTPASLAAKVREVLGGG